MGVMPPCVLAMLRVSRGSVWHSVRALLRVVGAAVSVPLGLAVRGGTASAASAGPAWRVFSTLRVTGASWRAACCSTAMR